MIFNQYLKFSHLYEVIENCYIGISGSDLKFSTSQISPPGIIMSDFDFIKAPDISNVGGVSRYIWDGLEVRMTDSSNCYTWLDGNPKKYSAGAPGKAWIGSMLNQPNSDEVANCRIVDFSTKLLAAASKYMPSYPYVIK